MATANISMKEKLQATVPHNVFFTEVPGSKETSQHINSVQFSDLLCPTLGELKSSLHITYFIEIEWLMTQYRSHNLEKTPITLLFHRFAPKPQDFKNDEDTIGHDPAIDKYGNISYKKIKMPPFNKAGMTGAHHSRISLFQYKDGSLRVTVMGASLWSADWEHFQNMLWVSQTLSPLPKSSEAFGDSPTKFKSILLKYLASYSLPMLNDWIDVIERINFGQIRVFLVVSVPGEHRPERQLTLQQSVSNILSCHCNLPYQHLRKNESWELHVNVSGLGYFGKTPNEWMNDILKILRATNDSSDDKKDLKLKLIYPSVRNVLEGCGYGLMYEQSMHEKQLWLEDYLYQWKAETLKRGEAVASSKTYCMIEPSKKKMAWFLLTSANFSRNGWGFPGPIVKVRSYEAGVLFLPKFMDKDFFDVGHLTDKSTGRLFPILYDLPLIPYEEDDYPYVFA